jgi:hypothetical protein
LGRHPFLLHPAAPAVEGDPRVHGLPAIRDLGCVCKSAQTLSHRVRRGSPRVRPDGRSLHGSMRTSVLAVGWVNTPREQPSMFPGSDGHRRPGYGSCSTPRRAPVR